MSTHPTTRKTAHTNLTTTHPNEQEIAMSTSIKSHATRKTAHATVTAPNPNEQEPTMSTPDTSHATRKTAHATVTAPNPNEQEPTMSTPDASTPTTAPVSANAGTPATTPLFQQGPPSNAFIPAPPNGFIPSNEAYSGVLPRLIELGALSGAIADLQSFSDYATVLGSTVPPYDEIVAAFTLANEWSTMRKASFLWDKFAQMQEGIAWTTLRPLMEKLAPALTLASTHNASLPTKYASLAAVLNAKKTIAKKGASTRALNARAKAEGKPQTHGKAGRQRKKAADKALVAASTAAQTATTATPDPAATSVAAPAAATAASTAAPDTATTTAPHS